MLIRNEGSYVYEEGEIIRTDPVDGTELTPGQTIKLWISTGPDIVTKPMPNVVGIQAEKAREILGQMGFANVKTVDTDSNQPKGEVVTQSVQKNADTDVTSEILLQVSRGPKETQAPTEAAKEEVTKKVTIDLPSDRTEDYVVSIHYAGKTVMEGKHVIAGTESIEVTLTGAGTQHYDVYINDSYYKTVKVEFS